MYCNETRGVTILKVSESFHVEFIGMLIVYIHTKFHMLCSKGTLVIDISRQQKSIFLWQPCFFVSYSTTKKNYFNKRLIFLRHLSPIYHHFRAAKNSVSIVTPTSNFPFRHAIQWTVGSKGKALGLSSTGITFTSSVVKDSKGVKVQMGDKDSITISRAYIFLFLAEKLKKGGNSLSIKI